MEKKSDLRKKLSIFLIFFCVILSVAELVMTLYMSGGTGAAKDAKATYDKYYVMISEDNKSPFWRAVYEGAAEAGRDKGAYVEYLGEKYFDRYAKEDLMRIAISSQADGIIVPADETENMRELIDEAVSLNIPVITLYGDSTRSRRMSFVGIGSYNLGSNYGKTILELAASELTDKDTIRVAVLMDSVSTNSGQNILVSGIQETIEKEAANGISLSLVTVDNSGTFSAEEAIRELIFDRAQPDIVVCLNERNTTLVYQAVVDYNKVGQVHILGYYDSDAILKGIEREVIDATVSIDTNQMGHFCIDALSEYYELGYTSQYFTADIKMIDRDNVAAYKEGHDENSL